MLASDLESFTDLLAGVFDAYSRPAPKAATQTLWWQLLSEYPFDAVAGAFAKYLATSPSFPPTPAAIRDLLGANADKRPAADEAWAIALLSRDEAETIVWTPEIAEAFATCRPVLDQGDEVGARMAFKDAYGRIVGAARLRNEPVQWIASIGFDADRREQVLRKAESAGLLPAPQVAALLPPPDGVMSETDAEIARANTAKLKAMLAGVVDKREEGRLARLAAEKAELEGLKARANERIRQYEQRSVA